MTHRGPLCLLITLAIASLPPDGALGAPVTTAALLEQGEARAAREHLRALLDREQMREELEDHGVSPAEAAARIAALSDAEVVRLSGRLEELEAGGGAAEVILLVLLILIIFELAGITDMFPWLDPPRR